jgi:hypothetical protein
MVPCYRVTATGVRLGAALPESVLEHFGHVSAAVHAGSQLPRQRAACPSVPLVHRPGEREWTPDWDPELLGGADDLLDSKQYSRMLDEWQAATSAALARTSAGK